MDPNSPNYTTTYERYMDRLSGKPLVAGQTDAAGRGLDPRLVGGPGYLMLMRGVEFRTPPDRSGLVYDYCWLWADIRQKGIVAALSDAIGKYAKEHDGLNPPTLQDLVPQYAAEVPSPEEIQYSPIGGSVIPRGMKVSPEAADEEVQQRKAEYVCYSSLLAWSQTDSLLPEERDVRALFLKAVRKIVGRSTPDPFSSEVKALREADRGRGYHARYLRLAEIRRGRQSTIGQPGSGAKGRELTWCGVMAEVVAPAHDSSAEAADRTRAGEADASRSEASRADCASLEKRFLEAARHFRLTRARMNRESTVEAGEAHRKSAESLLAATEAYKSACGDEALVGTINRNGLQDVFHD
jgi:hypothetical protein